MVMQLYKVIRFYKSGRRELIRTGLTLKEAQRHCQSESTHKLDRKGNVVWFDGYTKQ